MKVNGLNITEIMSLASNDFGNVSLYKSSFHKRVLDYQIVFKNVEVDFSLLVNKTFDLFLEVLESNKGDRILARLVAKVNFIHVNTDGREEERSYHFSSDKTQEIGDPLPFFKSNMLKIANRLETFNKEGSHLVLKNIEHIHILITRFT